MAVFPVLVSCWEIFPQCFHGGWDDEHCYHAFLEQSVPRGLGDTFHVSYDSLSITVVAGLSQKYIPSALGSIDNNKHLGRERMNPREQVNF